MIIKAEEQAAIQADMDAYVLAMQASSHEFHQFSHACEAHNVGRR